MKNLEEAENILSRIRSLGYAQPGYISYTLQAVIFILETMIEEEKERRSKALDKMMCEGQEIEAELNKDTYENLMNELNMAVIKTRGLIMTVDELHKTLSDEGEK